MDRTALRFGVNLGRLGTPGPPRNEPAGTPIEVAGWAEHAPSGASLAEMARVVRSCAG